MAAKGSGPKRTPYTTPGDVGVGRAGKASRPCRRWLVRKGTSLPMDEQGPLPGSHVSMLAEKPRRMTRNEATRGALSCLSRVERRVSSEVQGVWG